MAGVIRKNRTRVKETRGEQRRVRFEMRDQNTVALFIWYLKKAGTWGKMLSVLGLVKHVCSALGRSRKGHCL